MFHSHLFVPTFLVIWYSHFFNCVLWDFLGRSCSLFHRYFLWCWKQERGRENREFFVCNWLCVRGVMSYRFGRWVHDVPTSYVLTVQVSLSLRVVSGGLCSKLPDRPNRHAFHIFPFRFLLFVDEDDFQWPINVQICIVVETQSESNTFMNNLANFLMHVLSDCRYVVKKELFVGFLSNQSVNKTVNVDMWIDCVTNESLFHMLNNILAMDAFL